MSLQIHEIKKSELPEVLNDSSLWQNSFLVGTRHRLWAHYNNKKAASSDIIMIIAYYDDVLIGYMGVYVDHVFISEKPEKIGWLSTWWLHPDSAGKGIGKQMLERMYDLYNGQIGISQFTPSAKRVYDKSEYFYSLKKLEGCKIDLRLNLSGLLPVLKPTFTKVLGLLRFIDLSVNRLIELRLMIAEKRFRKSLENVRVDYLTFLDDETASFIADKQRRNLTRRDPDFFHFVKSYQWIQESPIISKVVHRKDYAFSGYNQLFNTYLVQIKNEDGQIIAFYSLLRKDKELKVLQVFYQDDQFLNIARSIILHGIKLGVSTIITYDKNLSEIFKKDRFARIRYKRKERESIISKKFGEHNYANYDFQYGDGDCSFA